MPLCAEAVLDCVADRQTSLGFVSVVFLFLFSHVHSVCARDTLVVSARFSTDTINSIGCAAATKASGLVSLPIRVNSCSRSASLGSGCDEIGIVCRGSRLRYTPKIIRQRHARMSPMRYRSTKKKNELGFSVFPIHAVTTRPNP